MKTVDMSWLISDEMSQRAKAKFDIQILEYHLNLLARKDGPRSCDMQERIIEICLALQQHYLKLSEFSPQSLVSGVVTAPYQEEVFSSFKECLEAVDTLKLQLKKTLGEVQKAEIVSAISQKYYYGSALVSQQMGVSKENDKYDTTWVRILEAKEPAAWLKALIHLASQMNIFSYHLLVQQLKAFSAPALQRLAHVYAQPEWNGFIRAIFFFKLYPEKLFSQKIHPEKVISVKQRLTVIYHFIEVLHQALAYVMARKGIPKGRDDLFHDEELPQGIEIDISEKHRLWVLAAVKSPLLNPSFQSERATTSHIENLIRAYKYWFNPNRLIDATMNIYQKSIINPSTQTWEVYDGFIKGLYKSLDTSECLNLFGYLNNKDTNYLMRTLFILSEGGKSDWLPALSMADEEAIKFVYQVMDKLIRALIEELGQRCITTQPYEYDRRSKFSLNPGRRNRNAVLRIIRIYSKKNIKPNKKILELFKKIES